MTNTAAGRSPTAAANNNTPPPERPPRRNHPSGADLSSIQDIQTLSTVLGNRFSIIESLIQDYKAEVVREIKDLETRLSDRIVALEIEKDTLVNNLSFQKAQNEKLESRLSAVESQLKLAVRHEVENEQYSRKSSARFFNLPPPSHNEDCKLVVCGFVNEKMQIDGPPLVPDDIDIAHRVGKPSQRGTQTMLCKFMRRTDKMRVLKYRKQLVGSGFGVSDDIARAYIDYMDLLKQREDVAQVWFFDGKCFLKPKGTTNRCNPRLNCNVDKLIKDTLSKPQRPSRN